MVTYGRPIPQRLLQLWKYQAISEAGDLLLGLFGRFWEDNRTMTERFFQGATVVPVPLHSVRLAERGFNQAEVIAVVLAETFNLPVRTDILRRRWQWKKQATISDPNKRSANAAGTVVIRSNAPVPKKIVLVDDVMTTGATLSLCARKLKEAGCEKVYAVTVLRG